MASHWRMNTCLLILVALCVLDTASSFKLMPKSNHKRGGNEGKNEPANNNNNNNNYSIKVETSQLYNREGL